MSLVASKFAPQLVSDTNLGLQIKDLSHLLHQLSSCHSPQEKVVILKQTPKISEAIEAHPLLFSLLSSCSELEKLALLSAIAIDQLKNIFLDNLSARKLILELVEVESTYQKIGGIVGYQIKILEQLLSKQGVETLSHSNRAYLDPYHTDIANPESADTRRFVVEGIRYLGKFAEIYPVGGSGDRLGLIAPETQQPLPVAALPFAGYSLLGGLVRDLQAREYMHYKLFGQQLMTPIGIMTSDEKNNHSNIELLCAEAKWFGRPANSFMLFKQPLAPVVSESGQWLVQKEGSLYLKPGGHGLIWKSAIDAGVFEWFETLSRDKALVRQINNPMAGIDHGLSAFSGFGFLHNKKFGFASCSRLICTAEGVNILLEEEAEGNYSYCLSNIEYTVFEQKGIIDGPQCPGSCYSRYPANTNILFVDIQAVKLAAENNPLPGLMVNMKERVVSSADPKISYRVGRLEAIMQNLADEFVVHSERRLTKAEMQMKSPVFLTYNERAKTIAVTKTQYQAGQSLLETPEGAFFTLLQNHAKLLKEHCAFDIPELGDAAHYICHGPNFIFLFHPALGPLYSIIKQKVRKGRLAEGSELVLDIAEVDIEGLEVEGSLLVKAAAALGNENAQGYCEYSEKGSSKCTLRGVRVQNRGIDYEKTKCSDFYKNKITRTEGMTISLEEGAEFYAEDVTFIGPQTISVPAYQKCTAHQSEQGIEYSFHPIAEASWHWFYRLSQEERIVLERIEKNSPFSVLESPIIIKIRDSSL